MYDNAPEWAQYINWKKKKKKLRLESPLLNDAKEWASATVAGREFHMYYANGIDPDQRVPIGAL